MSILLNKNTKVIVQGITGRDGSFHAQQMAEYGTQVVGGVTPGKSGQNVAGIPVFDSVKEAQKATGADATVIFVPARMAPDAIYEAAEAGIKLIVCITEGVAVNDMVACAEYVKVRGSRLIGPNCPGLITPGEGKMGIMPGFICKPGRIGVVSRSGTLTYEVVYNLTNAGYGQSTCLGIGGDPVIGTTFLDALQLFEADPDTDAVVMMGEIGGNDEERAAEYIKTMRKPVIGFISGRTAPPGKRMGHAGAIVSGGLGTAEAKVAAFQAAGVPVADTTADIVDLLKERLAKLPAMV
ncbi:MAG: succinate--CoA ligase subunit alpha [Candidatus Sericytochromatia bacterium]|nr:succinate--CoA ligase subunit alpha [Candidatus Sericytochromatia bacterium]